jgi:uracil-DNA glycosylase
MRVSKVIGCRDWPCTDIRTERHQVPGIEIDPERFSTILVSEAAPANVDDYYYSSGDTLFAETTVLAFGDAGQDVRSIQDILALGVYMTTAVKCAKTRYGLSTATVRACSHLLEQELMLFPNARSLLLMGSVAIKAVNAIARRVGEGRVIPAGSTYKLRGQPYSFRGCRVFPSYLQAGPSYLIEKSKRRIIAEDIAAAMAVASR